MKQPVGQKILTNILKSLSLLICQTENFCQQNEKKFPTEIGLANFAVIFEGKIHIHKTTVFAY